MTVRLASSLLAAVAALGIATPLALAQQPAPGQPTVVDGPSPNIVRPTGLGMSIARDGTGGLVYLKEDPATGLGHVFVSRLLGGSFQTPQQVDVGGLSSGSSSQPVIAAGNGGVLLIAFVNGGQLYVVQGLSSSATFTAPTPLVASATNPSLQMSNFGKAYLAFTVTDGGGDDVKTAYYNGKWAVESSPLNATPADNAGTGAGRPQVAAAGDGVGVVAWGEGGHVYSRRVWGTAPSVVYEQADAPLPGCDETSADRPVVGVGGDSSYADVAFHETLTCAGAATGAQSRVLMNRLHGSAYDGIVPVDGVSSAGTDGADDPQIAIGEYGHGFITSARQSADDLFATALGGNGVSTGTAQVNGLSNAGAPQAIPAILGLFSDLVAWQQSPGTSGTGEIRVRYAPSGESLGPELVVSSPDRGPTDAASGLAAAGDIDGDAAIAWVQGAPGSTQIIAAQLYQPPGPPTPLQVPQYVRTSQPVLTWSPARERWGPVNYLVSVDGAQLGQTQGTSLKPTVLADGPHTWLVTAVNPAGQSSVARPATVFVDTVAPSAQFSVYGTTRVGSLLHLYLTYQDSPPPSQPVADASGVAKVTVSWGDGTVQHLLLGRHREFHAYRAPGLYVVSVLAVDRAGNATTQSINVRIVPRPRPPKPKRPPKPSVTR